MKKELAKYLYVNKVDKGLITYGDMYHSLDETTTELIIGTDVILLDDAEQVIMAETWSAVELKRNRTWQDDELKAIYDKMLRPIVDGIIENRKKAVK